MSLFTLVCVARWGLEGGLVQGPTIPPPYTFTPLPPWQYAAPWLPAEPGSLQGWRSAALAGKEMPGGINCTCPTHWHKQFEFKVLLACGGNLIYRLSYKKGKHQLIQPSGELKKGGGKSQDTVLFALTQIPKHSIYSWAHTKLPPSRVCLFHTRPPHLHNARVHTPTTAIIQPDNHGHFHENGACVESGHSGLSICCTMWLPHKRGTSRVWWREKKGYPHSVLGSSNSPLWFSTEPKRSFSSSNTARAQLQFLRDVADAECPQGSHECSTGVKLKGTSTAAGDLVLRTRVFHFSQLGSEQPTPWSQVCSPNHWG